MKLPIFLKTFTLLSFFLSTPLTITNTLPVIANTPVNSATKTQPAKQLNG
ncbi:MAG: hypothetical protein ACKO3K_09615 [Cuspidothrix sp.]